MGATRDKSRQGEAQANYDCKRSMARKETQEKSASMAREEALLWRDGTGGRFSS